MIAMANAWILVCHMLLLVEIGIAVSVATECGSVKYNPGSHMCCGSTINVIPENRECCGEMAYDRFTHICCRGVVNDRPTNAEERCCGNKNYNPVTQVCCPGDNVYAQVTNGKERCCGSKNYNPDYDICCEYRGDSGVYKKSDGYHGCCKTIGTRDYEMCCGGAVVDNLYASSAGTSCCTDRYWLDIFEHGKIPEGNMPWGIEFNIHTQFCCIESQGHVSILTVYEQELCLRIRI